MDEREKEYYRAFVEILQTGYWLIERINGVLKPYNFTEPQYNVMKILEHHNRPVSVRAIQRYVMHKSSNITRIVDKLVTKGYVDRHIDPKNRRMMAISITDRGRSILKELNAEITALHAPMQAAMEIEDSRTLRRLLEQFQAEGKV